MTDYRVTFEYRERGERLDGTAHAFSSDTPILRRFSVKCFATSAARVDELKIELKRLPAIKKARRR
jgi:hypothetical protein